MKLKDLQQNSKNPRKITPEKLAALKASLEKFGDLGGIVYNRRSKKLVSGHQRAKSLDPSITVKITKKYETPTSTMTVAEGEIGEFRYREVDADEIWETEALLAANKHGGEWDMDLLKIIVADVPQINFDLAGFPEMKIHVPKLSIMEHVPVAEEIEETDEQYAARTSNTGEERVATVAEELNAGAPPVSSNAFAEVKEDLSTKNNRHLVIIDCPSVEKKNELKEKLRADNIIEQFGVKIF